MAVAFNYPLRPASYASVSVAGSNYHVIYNEIAITAAFEVNNTAQMFVGPKGFRVLGATLGSDDLDTDGTPAIVLALGDAVDDDRFISGATVAQAGGATTAIAAAGFGHVFTEDTPIFLKCTTAPDVGTTTGKVRAALYGIWDKWT